MLSNFIYALNATMPTFAVMVFGYVLYKKSMISDGFVASANKLTFHVALPVLIFLDIAGMEISQLLDYKFLLFCVCTCAIFIAAIWLLARLFVKDKTMVGSFTQGAYRSSVAVLGVVLVQNIYGSSGYAPMMILAAVPIYNFMAVIILSFESGGGVKMDKARIKATMLNIVKNPLIIAIVCGLPFAFFEITLPQMLDKTLNSVASLATPLALLSIGAGFKLGDAAKRLKLTAVATTIKLFVLPLVFLPIAYFLGFRDAQLVAILVMLGAPSTPSGYIMAKSMGNDGALASGIVVASTLFAAISLTFWIFIARTIGAI